MATKIKLRQVECLKRFVVTMIDRIEFTNNWQVCHLVSLGEIKPIR